MAYNSHLMDYHTGTRGSGGIAVYNGIGNGDNLSTIKGANFFDDNSVRSFIQRQGQGSPASVICKIVGTDGLEDVMLRINAANGQVIIVPGGGFINS